MAPGKSRCGGGRAVLAARRPGITRCSLQRVAGNVINNNNNTTMFIQGTNKPYKGMTAGPVVS